MTLKIWWWSSSNAGALWNTEYLFIVIATWSTLTQSGSTWKGPVYESNGTIWHLNWEQINDSCKSELLEIELFDHLTVCKQMADV